MSGIAAAAESLQRALEGEPLRREWRWRRRRPSEADLFTAQVALNHMAQELWCLLFPSPGMEVALRNLRGHLEAAGIPLYPCVLPSDDAG